MVKRFIYPYILIAVAIIGLIAAIQIPNFVRQYQQRIDAHLIEVERSLAGFQVIADQFHGGSLEALIQKHERSVDPTFAAEAKPIRDMWQRREFLRAEVRALQVGLWQQIWFLATKADATLRSETERAFSPAVMLDGAAIRFALIFALVTVVVFDVFLRFLLWFFGWGWKKLFDKPAVVPPPNPQAPRFY